jgi:predicted kinase
MRLARMAFTSTRVYHCETYLQDLLEWDWMVTRPAVVVLAGPPCSGKSTAGDWLATALPGIHLHVDAILTAILPHSGRCLQDRLLAYDIAARAIQPVLDRGLSVILDCTYSRKEYRERVASSVPDDVPLVVIEFLVSVDVALARFENRRAHHAIDLTPAIVAEKVAAYPYGFGTATVNSEMSRDEIREQILRSLGGDLDRGRWADGGV